jgi:hypothetical protein
LLGSLIEEDDDDDDDEEAAKKKNEWRQVIIRLCMAQSDAFGSKM